MPRQSFVTSRPESLNWLDIIASQCNQVLSCLVCQYLYIFSFALHHELGPRLTDRVGLHSPLGLHLLFVSVFTPGLPTVEGWAGKKSFVSFSPVLAVLVMRSCFSPVCFDAQVLLHFTTADLRIIFFWTNKTKYIMIVLDLGNCQIYKKTKQLFNLIFLIIGSKLWYPFMT